MQYFGLDELNDLIKQGHRVLSVVPGEVLVDELAPEEGDEIDADEPQFSLAGFTMQVELEEK